MAAARPGISAAGIGVGSGVGVGAGATAGSCESCARTPMAGARPTTSSAAINTMRLNIDCLGLIGVILRAPYFEALCFRSASREDARHADMMLLADLRPR